MNVESVLLVLVTLLGAGCAAQAAVLWQITRSQQTSVDAVKQIAHHLVDKLGAAAEGEGDDGEL